MIFAMDEIGFQHTEKVRLIESESKRWRFIYDVAKDYGFEGIHLTPSLYKTFGLELHNIPTYFENFQLSLHLGGLYKLTTPDEYELLNKNVGDAFGIAIKHGMEDLSLHPPQSYGIAFDERNVSLLFFDRIISHWVQRAKEVNLTLSLETHVSRDYFLFRGLEEFIQFTDKHPGLGILIDLSHNYFDNYSEDTIIKLLGNRNIRALHISDALQNIDFRKGTHLSIGEGSVDFNKLMGYFSKFPGIFGVLEIKADNEKIRKSLIRLRSMII